MLGNAIAISESVPPTPGRFDQMSGETMRLLFVDRELERITVDVRAVSVYHLFDDSTANGLNRTTGDRLVMGFRDGKLDAITVIGGVEGIYVPENLLVGRRTRVRSPGIQLAVPTARVSACRTSAAGRFHARTSRAMQEQKPVRILRSTGLVKRYKKRTVVNNVSVEVRQGEVVGLLGPNGAGKTTTFYMIVGMIRPNGGTVYLDDTDITTVAMYRRARMGIGYLPQEASIFRKMTVEENILAVLQTRGMSGADQRFHCERLMNDFSITHLAKSKGYMLSGGERRRTEIARALATDPDFILLDEPFAGIDPIAVEEIMKIVAGLRERGIGVLVTDHNVHETLSITDRAYLLFEGQILNAGTSESLANDPEARKLYLGEKFKLDRYQ